MKWFWRRGRTVVYEPTGHMIEQPKMGKLSKNLCFEDKKVGWVIRREFKSYRDYVNYLKAKEAGEREAD